MKNNCKIHSDGICVFINSQIKAATTGKIVLLLINLILWPGYLYLAVIVSVENEKGLFLPFFAVLLFLVFVLGRYTIWNFWGEEYIRINTKSINYNRSYGIFSTNETKINIHRLHWVYEIIRYFDDGEYGRIHFFDYDKDNDPKAIFETTILIRKTDANTISENIKIIYHNEYFEETSLPPITLN
jgi:hypothetical protein